MAKIKNPLQFSTAFDVAGEALANKAVFDPTLNVDTRLFIDPLLLGKSTHPEMRSAHKAYEEHFGKVFKLLSVASDPSDPAWAAAEKLFRFTEITGTCLGYGAASIRGSGLGETLKRRLMATAKRIVELGVEDPDFFTLIPLIEPDIGPDRISDMTTRITFRHLAEFNERILRELNLHGESFEIAGVRSHFVRNPTLPSRAPVVLVPSDVLRDLPVATDWNEVCAAAAHNEALRQEINDRIGDIWTAKSKEQKENIRERALSSREGMTALLELVRHAKAQPYDLRSDPLGIFVWRRLLGVVAKDHPHSLCLAPAPTLNDLFKLVGDIVEQFRFLIEERGLARELWDRNGKRRPERSAQNMFFAVADSYCKANNVDITPEADTGTGVVDFKMSTGYERRVLVEIKLSDNAKVVRGYEAQLEVYKSAEQTTKAFYVVIDVGKMGNKQTDLLVMKNKRRESGEFASDTVFIDGAIKDSASKL